MSNVEMTIWINPDNLAEVTALNDFLLAVGNQTEEVKKPIEKKPKEVKEPVEETGIKIETIRAILAKKVDKHRDEIKAKLTELGSNNVTSLDKSKYEEFMKFMKGLK